MTTNLLRRRKRLTIQLGEVNHDAFLAFARSKNKRPSTLAKELLCKALREQEAILAEPERDYQNNALTGVFLRLTPDEVEVIDMVAKAYNVQRSKALIIVIRSVLLNIPTFTPEDRSAIYQSNQELRRIGGNLNQIAKEMSAYRKHQLIENKSNLIEAVHLLELLTQNNSLYDLIHNHIGLVKEVMAKGQNRF